MSVSNLLTVVGGVTMEEITINFGLIASEKFPDVARARVLTRGTVDVTCPNTVEGVACKVLAALLKIGCTVTYWKVRDSTTEPTLVVKLMYPVSDEKADCSPPSVLKYSKYTRLYEVACEYAQDAVAVLEEDVTGVLVGANCSDWGGFDKTKFITVGE